MILILTYHEVTPDDDGRSKFYTIAPERLQRQLELLAESGLEALSPEDMFNATASTRGYLLTFDDGTVDHYEVVRPLLERFKHRALFFIPTEKLDRPGYLSASQAREIGAAGNT